MQAHINARIQKVHQYILYVATFIKKHDKNDPFTSTKWFRNIHLGFSSECL